MITVDFRVFVLIIFTWIFLITASLCFGGEYFVAPNGNDSSPGTKEKPFGTISKAAKLMKKGDTCYIRKGRYHEKVSINNLHGTSDAPIIFKPYQNEEVIWDGSEIVKAGWKKYKGKIYKAQLKKDIWQVFVGDQSMTLARWPNGSFKDGLIWDHKKSWRHMKSESTFGKMIDERPYESKKIKTKVTKTNGRKLKQKYKIYTPMPKGFNETSLSSLDFDVTGAIAIMNIGSWLSWAQYVQSHEKSRNFFTYSTNFSASGPVMSKSVKQFCGKTNWWWAKNKWQEQGYYYLENKLELLDCPGEWFFDRSDRVLYIWTPDGESPANHKVRVKTQTYAIEIKKSSYIQFQGIDFFGTTFKMNQSRSMTVEDCNFMYPSYSKRALGILSRPEVTSIICSNNSPTQNTIRNCRFEYMDGPALDLKGMNDIIENCYFHDADFSCLGTGGEGTINTANTRKLTFRRNTVHTAGNSEGIRVGRENRIEFNHVYHTGLLQHDGSAINVGQPCIENTIIKNNWSHDTHKPAIRFDSVGVMTEDVVYGIKGSVINNVVWKSDTVKIKGNYHKVFNNTAFDIPSTDICVMDKKDFGGVNTESMTINNAASDMSGDFKKKEPGIPGIVKNNWLGDIRTVLRDPDNWDFRPKQGSPLIDKGFKLQEYPKRYKGDAPDIGAYEYGDATYWIPGYQAPQASTPVPLNNSATVKPDTSLIWLKGYRSVSHDIYFGTDKDDIIQADKKSSAYKGNQKNNIYDPGKLIVGKNYYWRVDAVQKDGKVIKGKVWNFKSLKIK